MMMNKKKYVALNLSICIIFSLLIQLILPTVAFAGEETIYIGSAEELISFAKKCSYDAFSIGKNVLLTNDISLKDTGFEPIATFGGTFDGQGHTISGLELSGAYSPVGLFSTIGKEATVKNLKVNGVISPSGDKGYVGGIAGDNSGRIENCEFAGTVIGSDDVGGITGINRVSGSISGCSVSGEIIGENRTGGIAGSNEGLISDCQNYAKINTISVTPTLSLDEINLSLTLDISKLPSLNNMTMSDTGGISGYSVGIIIGCENLGDVGYPHIGYNVGGIVGRSTGHLAGNKNSATVNGRKDVGGIAGQIEPYVRYELSEDLLASLKAELDKLGSTVNGVVGSAGEGIPGISSRLNTILTNIDGATDAIDKIIKDGSDYGEDFLGEINRVSEIVSEVISQLSGITDELPTLAEILGGSLTDLEESLTNLQEFSQISEGMLTSIIGASEDVSKAFNLIGSSIDNINIGLGELEKSITVKDSAAAKNAVRKISDNLSGFISATDSFTTALNGMSKILDDAPWMDEVVSEISGFVTVLGEISDAVSVIYEATLEIDENIDVYWRKIEEAGDGAVTAVGHFADMAKSLAEAIELMDSGIDKIESGLEKLYDSVIINNPDEIKTATKDIGDGINLVIDASGKAGLALSEISETVKGLNEESELSEVFSVLSDAFGNLAESGSEMSDAVSKLGSGISTVLNNVSVNFDGLEEGGSLVIGGAGDIADSMEKIKLAAKSMSDGMISLKNAVTALNEAVEVKDEEKLSEAFETAHKALGDIVEGAKELTSILKDMSKTLAEAKVWGDSLIDGIGEATEALTEMSGALVLVQEGIDSLRNNVSFELSNAKEGLSYIRRGLSAMSLAAFSLKDSFSHISEALTRLDSGSEYLNGAISDIKDCIGGIGDAMDSIALISEKLKDMVSYLKGVDTIQLPTPPESITATANQLFIYISAIENELKYLNTDLTGLSSDIIAQIGKINEIFGDISDNIVSIIYSLNDGSFIDSNVSEEEIDSITQGKLFNCINTGDVHGDKNVGGIGGTMGLEYTLDPEDDLSGELSVTQKKQYKLKAIIHMCHNEGDVTSKYDCVGGIVGKMDLGLIYGCEAYCTVENQSGSYVGGIAGITSGLISQCFAKSSLYGSKYVGGIVGSGVSESYSGDSSMVRNCYSMVYIMRYTQYAGAISGYNSGEFSENLFVSDTLAGIDRVSYLGKAEPISYEDLIKRRSIPDEFHRFTLEFVADGEVIKSFKFEYGSSFDSSVFPEIPEKKGYYGYWDVTNLQHLVFDTTVSVIYKPYITAIGSGESRDDGREIFFVQGEFVEGDAVSAEKGCDTSGLSLTEKFFTKDLLIESWVLNIPKDNPDVNNIHFLPENDHARIFIKLNGAWQQIDTTEFGSYLTFDVSGEKIEIAVVEHSVKLVPILLIGAGVLAVLAVVIVICTIARRKKKKNISIKEK
ncbi:MAG: hypothetical protein IJX58_06070 [Clostridia bacterium]|nr:hypothetical protein [Clostridia bacterium]